MGLVSWRIWSRKEGYLALYPAIDGYEPEKGIKFLTYAEIWIKQGMRRYIQNNQDCLRLPIHCQEKVWKYRRFVSAYESEYGAEPSEEEAAGFLGWSLEEVERTRGNVCIATVASLNMPLINPEGSEDGALIDRIVSDVDLENDITDQIMAEQARTVLWGLVDTLPGQIPEVIRRRFQDKQTLKQIGEDMGGKPTETVRQELNKGLRELRKPHNSKCLRPFFSDYERIYNDSLTGNSVARFNMTWTSSTERVALKL